MSEFIIVKVNWWEELKRFQHIASKALMKSKSKDIHPNKNPKLTTPNSMNDVSQKWSK